MPCGYSTNSCASSPPDSGSASASRSPSPSRVKHLSSRKSCSPLADFHPVETLRHVPEDYETNRGPMQYDARPFASPTN